MQLVAHLQEVFLGDDVVDELAAHVDDGVKACRNQPCHFGFFDRTRNSSAGFCSPGCSSQASMRAYRQRKKNPVAQ